jgi:hypothetical protein
MRSTKLNTEDLNKVINALQLSPAAFDAVFGPGATKDFTEMNAVLGGLTGQAGIAADQFASWSGILTDFDKKILFENAAGMAINNAQDWSKAIYRVGGSYLQLQKEIEAAEAAGRDTSRLLQEQVTLAQASGATPDQLAGMAQFVKWSIKSGKVIRSNADLIKYQSEMTSAWSDSNNTLTIQIAMLTDKLYTLLKFAVEPIRLALTLLAKVLNSVIWAVGEAVVWFAWWWGLMEKIPLLGTFFILVKYLAGGLAALAMVLVIAGGAVASFAVAFSSAAGLLKGAAAVIQSIGKAILAIVNIIGQSIVILLTAIGNGLAALGKAVAPVMLPLLAVGAALMMAGLGAYFFAQGVMLIATLPFGTAAASILLLIAAIGILGLVLVGLAYLAAPVAPILLIIGATFLMIGAAAWLLGAGLLMASQSLEAIAEFGSQIGFMTWVSMAAGITMLGAAAMVAAPGLLLVGAALLIVGPAAWLFAAAIQIISDSLSTLSAESLVSFGADIAEAAWYALEAATAMLLVGAAIVLAALSIMAGSLILVAAVPVLATAAVGLFFAGGAMLVAGGVIVAAAAVLVIGAAMLAVGGGLLFVSGYGVLSGASMILAGAMVLFPAVAMLFNAVLLLLPAAAGFLVGALMLIPAAAALSVASLAISAGSVALSWAVWLLKAPAKSLALSVMNIVRAARGLTTASAGLVSGISVLQNAVAILRELRGDELEGVAQTMLGLLPSLQQLASGISSIAAPFAASVEMFVTSLSGLVRGLSGLSNINANTSGIDQLTTSVTGLTNAVRGLSELSDINIDVAGLNMITVLQNLGNAIADLTLDNTFLDDVGQMVTALDSYSTQLESAVERIETAIQSKLLPAVQSAEQAGLKEAVRSEAITNVEVMRPSEPEDRSQTRMISLLEEQNVLLSTLTDVIGGLSSTDVTKIKELLEDRLAPENRLPGAVSSDLTGWLS